jgi:hypothetical protein
MDLVRDSNDTASRARASVTRLLGLLVAALAEVVGAGVDDDGALRKVSQHHPPRAVVKRGRLKEGG